MDDFVLTPENVAEYADYLEERADVCAMSKDLTHKQWQVLHQFTPVYAPKRATRLYRMYWPACLEASRLMMERYRCDDPENTPLTWHRASDLGLNI